MVFSSLLVLPSLPFPNDCALSTNLLINNTWQEELHINFGCHTEPCTSQMNRRYKIYSVLLHYVHCIRATKVSCNQFRGMGVNYTDYGLLKLGIFYCSYD